MIGNGICNPECNNKNCYNDSGDCKTESEDSIDSKMTTLYIAIGLALSFFVFLVTFTFLKWFCTKKKIQVIHSD